MSIIAIDRFVDDDGNERIKVISGHALQIKQLTGSIFLERNQMLALEQLGFTFSEDYGRL